MKNGRMQLTLSAVCLLASCSIVLEQAHLEYDPRKVVPNACRAEIEREIGAPEHVTTIKDGVSQATYVSARVSEDTKRSLVAHRKLADLFLFGGGEVLDPFAVSENESKIFVIVYGSDQRAQTVQAKCQQGWPRDFVAAPPQGFSPTCTRLLQG